MQNAFTFLSGMNSLTDLAAQFTASNLDWNLIAKFGRVYCRLSTNKWDRSANKDLSKRLESYYTELTVVMRKKANEGEFTYKYLQIRCINSDSETPYRNMQANHNENLSRNYVGLSNCVFLRW